MLNLLTREHLGTEECLAKVKGEEKWNLKVISPEMQYQCLTT